MASERPSVVLLARDREPARIVYHHLRSRFEVRAVVLEDAVPRRRFLARRLTRLGPSVVAGQLLFRLLVVPFLTRAARARTAEIKVAHGLDDRPIDADAVTRVSSVNSAAVHDLLRALSPDVVVINGTRLVSAETLAAVPATFLNVHAGITPRYRGVHGGYWALRERDGEHCGVTVHVVDEGLDSGPVLAQGRIRPTTADTFVTYPLLQLAAGLPLLADAVQRVASGDVRRRDPPRGGSKVWSHPTLWQYAAGRLRFGVK
jgi:folate-dependent phosphoribosylglycinamide formyltransferase PurN